MQQKVFSGGEKEETAVRKPDKCYLGQNQGQRQQGQVILTVGSLDTRDDRGPLPVWSSFQNTNLSLIIRKGNEKNPNLGTS